MSLQIEQVEGRSGLSRFINTAWLVQGGLNTPWVPPLRVMVRDSLSEQRNPFYQDAERALYVARRGKQIVGRIAAIENRRHNRYHEDRVGFFGFFECLEDQEAATELIASAEYWLKERGLNVSRGPVSPSMNHECGLLVAGFGAPPVIMTPWNPPYYADLIKGAGYAKIQDLLGYYIPAGDELAVSDRVRHLAERTRRRLGITFRRLDASTLRREARQIHTLYKEAWHGNWGFVPPSWDEFWHITNDMKSVLAVDFSFVAEIDDEIIGFMLIVRDVNRLLSAIPSGRLWPWNAVKLLFKTQDILSGRVVLLGLKTKHRHRGLFPLFAYEAARRALEIQAEGAEASWILEDNNSIVAPLEAMGLQPYKRWRIYEKELND